MSGPSGLLSTANFTHDECVYLYRRCNMHNDLVWLRDETRMCDGELVAIAWYRHVDSGREFWFYKH